MLPLYPSAGGTNARIPKNCGLPETGVIVGYKTDGSTAGAACPISTPAGDGLWPGSNGNGTPLVAQGGFTTKGVYTLSPGLGRAAFGHAKGVAKSVTRRRDERRPTVIA